MALPISTLLANDDSMKILWSILLGNQGNSTTDILTQAHASQTVVFADLAKYFNTGLLSLTFIVYAFILFAGTVNSAKDGTFLGRDWDGHWIPLRVVVGTISVIPLKSGYCLAQWAIFTMVSYGVYFADYVWDHVNNDVNHHGLVVKVDKSITGELKDQFAEYLLFDYTIGLMQGHLKPVGVFGAFDKTKSSDDSSGVSKYEYKALGSTDQNNYINEATDVKASYTMTLSQLDPSFLKSEDFRDIVNQSSDSDHLKTFDSSCFAQGESACNLVVSNTSLQQIKLLSLGVPVNIDIPAKWFQTKDGYPGFASKIVDKLSSVVPATFKSDTAFTDFSAFIKSLSVLSSQSKPDFYNSDVFNNFMSALVSALENENFQSQNLLSKMLKVSDDSDGDQLYDGGWWNGDIAYIQIATKLSENMTVLQGALQHITDNLLSPNKLLSGDFLEPQKGQAAKLSYQWLSTPLSSIFSTSSMMVPTQTDYPGSVQTPFSFTLSQHIWDLLQADMSQVATLNGLSKKYDEYFPGNNNEGIRNLAHLYLSSNTMPLAFSSYLLLIDQVVNQMTPIENQASSQQQDEVKNILLNTLNLLNFLNENGVSFLQNSSDVDGADISENADNLMNILVKKLTGSNSPVSNFLAQIYQFGINEHAMNSFNPSAIVKKSQSLLYQIETLGRTLIYETVSTMQNVYGYFYSQYDKMGAEARTSIQQGLDTEKASVEKMKDAQANISWLGQSIPIWSGIQKAEAAKGTYLAMALGASGTIHILSAQLTFAKNMYGMALQFMWMPLLMFVLLSVFTTGMLFCLFIPLSIFLLFWAGKVAWLLLVLEAMIAAPLVALSLIYPEGHQIYGKAQPGVQIAVNLMFRPVLMVIGLFCALILMEVVIGFSATGFHTIITSILGMVPHTTAGTGSYAYMIIALMVVLTYATFISMCFHKCFSIIYILPDKVMQWIGHSPSERAGEQDLQEVKGAMQQSSQQLGQAAQSTGDQGAAAHRDGQQQMTQATAAQSQGYDAQRNAEAHGGDEAREGGAGIQEGGKIAGSIVSTFV